jgi:hypothetical protein
MLPQSVIEPTEESLPRLSLHIPTVLKKWHRPVFPKLFCSQTPFGFVKYPRILTFLLTGTHN